MLYSNLLILPHFFYLFPFSFFFFLFLLFSFFLLLNNWLSRLKVVGIRQILNHHPEDSSLTWPKVYSSNYLTNDSAFRHGFSLLQKYNLSFDLHVRLYSKHFILFIILLLLLLLMLLLMMLLLLLLLMLLLLMMMMLMMLLLLL